MSSATRRQTARVRLLVADESGRVAEGYCGQIKLHLETLNTPQIDDGADIERTIDIYRTITSAAPAAIEPEWQQLLATVETASTVDPELNRCCIE